MRGYKKKMNYAKIILYHRFMLKAICRGGMYFYYECTHYGNFSRMFKTRIMCTKGIVVECGWIPLMYMYISTDIANARLTLNGHLINSWSTVGYVLMASHASFTKIVGCRPKC